MSVFLAVVYNNYKKYLKVPPRISGSCWPGAATAGAGVFFSFLLRLFWFLQRSITLWPLGGDAAAGQSQEAQDGAGLRGAAAAAAGGGACGEPGRLEPAGAAGAARLQQRPPGAAVERLR